MYKLNWLFLHKPLQDHTSSLNHLVNMCQPPLWSSSYRSSGVLLWGSVSAHPDTCPERAGSCPLCTRCAASSPLSFCGATGQTPDIKYQNMMHSSIPAHVIWGMLSVMFSCTHSHAPPFSWTACVLSQIILHKGRSPAMYEN